VFERFLSSYAVERLSQPGLRPHLPEGVEAQGFMEFMDRFAGATFSKGLYRLHDLESAERADALIRDAFPEFKTRAHSFGVDWLGCFFALDLERHDGHEPLVLMFEPGTGEALQIPATFAAFHDEELVVFKDAALAVEFFEAWSRDHPESLPLQADTCVGYKVPLFLGGRDTVENLELIDLAVYWTICGQLRRGTRHLPVGTTISTLRAK
jgi:hypothetical protein